MTTVTCGILQLPVGSQDHGCTSTFACERTDRATFLASVTYHRREGHMAVDGLKDHSVPTSDKCREREQQAKYNNQTLCRASVRTHPTLRLDLDLRSQEHAPSGKAGVQTKATRTYPVHPVHPVVTTLSLAATDGTVFNVTRSTNTFSFSLCSFIILYTVLHLMRKTLRTM